MPTLTPFGIEVRKIRLEKSLLLLDMAETLGVTPAFVSAVETGKKPIPSTFIQSIAQALHLTPEEIDRLERAADRSRKQVSVEHLAADGREIVAAVSRLRPEELAVLRRRLLKALSEELPFRRSPGIVVSARSQVDIMRNAEGLRSILLPDDHIYFPVISVLELALPDIIDGFYLEVSDKETMGDDEGHVIAGRDSLTLREDVYIGACKGRARDRFTACHELGHFLLHNEVVLARTRQDKDKIYCDSEWQADFFAGALMMSKRHLRRFVSSSDAAEQCGMSEHAARVMWGKHQQMGSMPDIVQLRLL